MAARFDVAARLMEGLEAVDEMQSYVEACRMRGYQHADLTVRGTQIRDWYTAEEALDLRVLDADCATLRGIAGDAGEALRSARSQAVALADAWTGEGGVAAAEFIRRQCNTAEVLVDAVRATADACAVLRDELWRVVDRRVAQTQGLVDRARAQRPVWLAAARAVAAGGQGHDDAVQIVDGQVKPFVDSAIGVEWVSAMRSADGDAERAYRVAVDMAGGAARLRFEVPGDLGPRYSVPAGVIPASAPTAPDAVAARMQVLPGAARPAGGEGYPAPADLVAPPAPPPGTPPTPPTWPVAAPPPPDPSDALTSVPAASPASGLPGFGTAGLPDLGGSNEPPGRLADALSGWPDPPALPEVDTPDEPEAHDPETDEADDPETDEAGEPEAGEPEAAGEENDEEDPMAAPTDPLPAPDCSDDPPAPPPEQPAPTPVPESVPVTDPPPPTPADTAGTPCEIAADELPQAGE